MNEITQAEAPRGLPALQAGSAVRAIVPTDFDSAWRIANAVVVAGMAPAGLDTPERAMVAIMHGLEVGLTPMTALQSIAVINGRPTIWGDGAIGLVRGSGKLEWIKERIEGTGDAAIAICECKRKGDPEIIKGKFSVTDAKRAGLWEKRGAKGQPTPWITYPARMLTMRARAFALRDGFADVLKGLGIAEEVQDFMINVTPTAPEAPIPPMPPVPPQTAPQPPQPPTVVSPPVQSQGAPATPAATETVTQEVVDETTGEIFDGMGNPLDGGPVEEESSSEFFNRLEEGLMLAANQEQLEEIWTDFDPMATFEGTPTAEIDQSIAKAIKSRALKRFQ